MVEYAYIDPVMNGLVVSSFDPSEEGITQFYEVPDHTNPNNVYIAGGAVYAKPPKPSQLSTWNNATNSWDTPNTAQAEVIFTNANYTVHDIEFTVDTVDLGIIMRGGFAQREKGFHVERKPIFDADFWHPGNGEVVFFYYDWDVGYIGETLDLSVVLASLKRVYIGEYDGVTFKEGVSKPMMDGQRVISRSIGANQLVADKAIIGTLQVEDLFATRIKIANGAVSEQGIFSVWHPSGAYQCNYVTADPGDWVFFDDQVEFWIGIGQDAVSRLIIRPEFYGAEKLVSINRPIVSGVRHAEFSIGFKLFKNDYDEATDSLINPVLIYERGASLNKLDWNNQNLYKALGGDPTTGLVNDFAVNLGEHYSEGQVLTLKMGYCSFSPTPTECGITRRIPGFGFAWESYWK